MAAKTLTLTRAEVQTAIWALEALNSQSRGLKVSEHELHDKLKAWMEGRKE